MRTFILLFCSVAFSINPSNGFSQNAKIKIDYDKSISVEEIFSIIKTQTDYTFVYRYDLIKESAPVFAKKGIIKAGVLLKKGLDPLNLMFEFVNNTVIVKKKTHSVLTIPLQVMDTIKGAVIDDEGEPLFGVNVLLKGTLRGATTDLDGNYKIKIPNNIEGAVLVFSYIGYNTIEVPVENKTIINMKMEASNSDLEEIVIIGYGTSKVKDVTGSVARISAKDLANAPMGASVQSMLQGKSSGVSVNIQSASPTSPVSVVIRGASSLSGNNQPLWVIDGVPQYSASTSGDIANTLYNLNLNDVQSIDILKDASATAVYGSRAASGVVIVTTKKGGTFMKPTIQISSRIGVQKQNFNDFKYMETHDFKNFNVSAAGESIMSRGNLAYFDRSIFDRQAFRDLNTSEFDQDDLVLLEDAFLPGNTNWQDEMTTDPFIFQQDLSIRGGSAKTTYYVSFNHKKTEGIIKGGNSALYGGRLNLDTKISDKLRFGINLNASTRKTDNKDNMLSVLKKIRPDLPPFNDDGTIYTKDVYTENPYTTLRNTNHGKGLALSVTGFFELDIIKDLQFKSSFTNNYSDSESSMYNRKGTANRTIARRTFSNSKNSINVWENTLAYAKLFSNMHDIKVLAGYSMENSISRSYYLGASNFPDDDVLNNFGSAADRPYVSDGISENALVSQFARVHYKFDDRYIISSTVRRDGSSRFGADQRWGFFPSAAAAWLITGEKFMKTQELEKIFSYLKLRFSIGKTGSQNLGNYDWVSGVGSNTYNASPAILPTSLGNPILQWEQTRMTDLGLDYGLFDHRIRGTIGMYQKNSSELIYTSPLPPSSAYNSVRSNVASVENNGVEFDLKYDILRKVNSRLTLDFNIATNKNIVTKINNQTQELNFPSNRDAFMKVKPGELTGEWYGYKTAGRLLVTAEESIALQGIDNAGNKVPYRHGQETLGDMYFIDQNNDGVINEDDRVKLGSSTPTAFGGFGLTYQHKGLRVNATFNYAFGHKRFWTLPREDIRYVGRYNQNNLIAGQSATMVNPYDAKYPRMAQSQLALNSDFSDLFLHNASYLRLSALNVAYRIPEGYFKKLLVKGVDLTFQATNLFTITKYPGFDPQGNWSSSSIGSGMGTDYGTYPSSQTFNLGIKFTLK